MWKVLDIKDEPATKFLIKNGLLKISVMNLLDTQGKDLWPHR